MKIIAIWHSDMAHLTAFANQEPVKLLAVVEDRAPPERGFWAVYDTTEWYKPPKGTMWK